MSEYEEGALCPNCGNPEFGTFGFCPDCNPEDEPVDFIDFYDNLEGSASSDVDFDDDDIPF